VSSESLACGGAILASYILREVPGRYPNPPGWGLGMGLGSPPHIKYVVSDPGNGKGL